MTAVPDQKSVLQALRRACATKEDARRVSALFQGQVDTGEVNGILERAL